MSRETQAELFIRTVAEMLDELRDRQRALKQRQQRDRAERFLRTYPAGRALLHVAASAEGHEPDSRP